MTKSVDHRLHSSQEENVAFSLHPEQADILDMTIGTAMRQAREAAGLTQVELAKKAKVHRTYISQLEHGHKSPTLDVFIKICEAMEIAPSEVMSLIERKR